jgi:mannose-6-phosphate isomerase-like protein (cupin superfamily)
MSVMIAEIRNQGKLLGLIVRHCFQKPGIHFFTGDDATLQLGYMQHPAGKIIEPHIHNPVPREVCYTFEVLFVKRGRVRVDFFDEKQNYLESRILEAGDTILLATGGHGFEALEELEMIEIKQGPYAGNRDKTRFNGKLPTKLNFGTTASV